jgi:hypothetical protein
MIGPYQYGTIPNRTHLSERERSIWAAFMEQYPGFFEHVWYDVEVGGMRGGTDGLKPQWAQNAKYLGRYKIDVVGEHKDYIAVVEVKGEATTKALGEIWLYDDLFKQEWDTQKPVRNIIVSDEEMPNIRAACEKEGVELLVVSGILGREPTEKETPSDPQENAGKDEAKPLSTSPIGS